VRLSKCGERLDRRTVTVWFEPSKAKEDRSGFDRLDDASADDQVMIEAIGCVTRRCSRRILAALSENGKRVAITKPSFHDPGRSR
jgi:hypothetical protein